MAVGEFRRMFCVLALVWLLGFSVGCVFGQNGGHSFVYTREYLLNLRDFANRGLDLQNIEILLLKCYPVVPAHTVIVAIVIDRGRRGREGKKGVSGRN